MPSQIIPIQDVASAGVIQDTPNVSLPPQVFSDVRNVRFKDGAVRKMPGEADFRASLTDVRYVAFWPAPSGDKYVILSAGLIQVYDDNGDIVPQGTQPALTDTTDWQHTIFNGGFHIILNNGIDTPVFIQDETTLLISSLPGWDSYAVDQSIMNFEHDGSALATLVESDLIMTGASVKITAIPRNVSDPIRTETIILGTDDGTLAGIGTVGTIMAGSFRFTPGTTRGGTNYIISIVTAPIVSVTAGVVRAYGNLLVAGDLVERDAGDNVIRRLTGTIRTSDVAAPGMIPENWNPFFLGVNTADEFILASTGTVQDMVELQGVLYVYTDSSIHSIQQTGNPNLPFQIAPVTDSYGASNTGSVLEVDGKHIVVGSNDVFIFAGHPGSIASIADGKVRYQDFFTNTDIQIIRFNMYDELWFWSPSTPVMYTWNYRTQVWSIREDTQPISATVDRAGPVFATDTLLYTADTGFTAADTYLERRRLAMAPEFTTENLASVALFVDGNGELNFQVVASDVPGADVDPTTASDKLFQVNTEYKQDIRVHGRFLNYRITHEPDTTDNGFNLSGMQFDISTGGTR